MVLLCLTPPCIIPQSLLSLRPGRSRWPLLCDWINPRVWDNGCVTATGRMWQENNQPTTVPFQSPRQWSLLQRRRNECKKKITLLGSFTGTHEWELKITSLRGVADRHTSVITLDVSFLFVPEEGFFLLFFIPFNPESTLTWKSSSYLTRWGFGWWLFVFGLRIFRNPASYPLKMFRQI